MVYILKLGRVYRALNIDIWRSRSKDYSRKEALGSSIINISNRIHDIVLNISYIG
jgi:hypothetical protein